MNWIIYRIGWIATCLIMLLSNARAQVQGVPVKYTTVGGVDFYAKLWLHQTDAGTVTNKYEYKTFRKSELFVSFYADAACTVPFAVNNFPLHIEQTISHTNWIDGQPSTNVTNENQSYYCNGPEMRLLMSFKSWEEYWDRTYWAYLEDMSEDHNLMEVTFTLLPGGPAPEPEPGGDCSCNCLKPFFDYLIQSKRLFTRKDENVTIGFLVQDANYAGFRFNPQSCALLAENINKPFYATTADSVSQVYRARLGDCNVSIHSASSSAVNFLQLVSGVCNNAVNVPYTGPGGTVQAQLELDSCFICSEATSTECYSAVTDTTVNPYTFGIVGNWRAARSYAYYVPRAETEGAAVTDIRTYGAYQSFRPFWAAGQAARIRPQYDTLRWAWNAEVTNFNRRGLELETVDALGRYSAELYGFDETVPVAVVQNARLRESAYEGFEDYNPGNTDCPTGDCGGNRALDFTSNISLLDTLEQHTGLYSLKVPAGTSVGISAAIQPLQDGAVNFTFRQTSRPCGIFGGKTREYLEDIRINSQAIIQGFSPLAGKKVLVSAWVKEAQDCKCTSYSNNQLVVLVKNGADSIAVTAQPAGPIIEGWQRIELVADVPADAVRFALFLSATANADVHFDDIRVHPFNANMKSFVYHPVNLRLMAELDENNYATLYEYDDDGTLIRLKKRRSEVSKLSGKPGPAS